MQPAQKPHRETFISLTASHTLEAVRVMTVGVLKHF